MADESLEKAKAEAREALAALRGRLDKRLLRPGDFPALIQFIDARLEAGPDDEEFDLWVARSACAHLGALVDDLRAEIASVRAPGWKLVPLVPTNAMLAAAVESWGREPAN